MRPIKRLSENRLGEGDSPILLRGLRKIGTVPDGFRIGIKPKPPRGGTPGEASAAMGHRKGAGQRPRRGREAVVGSGKVLVSRVPGYLK